MKFAISSNAVLVALAFAGPAQAQTQVVSIGHSGPLSGPNAFAGKDNENGVRMAVEELNAKKIKVGGKTLEFKLNSEDDQCDARSRVYSQGGTMVSTVGTNPKVTDGGYKNLFRIIASDTQIGSNMATYAANVMKVKNVAVIDDRTAFGQGVADEFSKEAKKLGLNIVGHEFTTDKSTDFLAILTNLKAKQPTLRRPRPWPAR